MKGARAEGLVTNSNVSSESIDNHLNSCSWLALKSGACTVKYTMFMPSKI